MADAVDIRSATCRQCGCQFSYEYTRGAGPRTCSDICRRNRDVERKRVERRARGSVEAVSCRVQFSCLRCRKVAEATALKERVRKFCSRACYRAEMAEQFPKEAKMARVRARHAVRRARKRSPGCEKFDPFEIFERDGWRCHICHTKTPKRFRGSGRSNSPELDHIVPLARGGVHSRANTACCCRRCNGHKKAKILGQPSLLSFCT